MNVLRIHKCVVSNLALKTTILPRNNEYLTGVDFVIHFVTLINVHNVQSTMLCLLARVTGGGDTFSPPRIVKRIAQFECNSKGSLNTGLGI